MLNGMKTAVVALFAFGLVGAQQVGPTKSPSTSVAPTGPPSAKPVQAPTGPSSAMPVQAPVLVCTRDEDPNTIYLAGITPVDTTDFAWTADIFEYTVQLINEGWRDDILPGFGNNDGLRLTYSLENSNCSENLAVRRYWALRTKNGNVPPHGVIGDRCSGATISLARITGLESVPLVSPASTSAKLSSNDDFPFFSRLVAPDNEHGEVGALIALLREFGWEQVTVLATDTDL
jgi:Receptor family ligand binding region